MKYIYLLLLSVGLLCSEAVMAEDWVRCDPMKINSIKIRQNGDLLYRPKANGYGNRLAFKGSSDQTAKNEIMANILIMTIEKGYLLQALYPKGYDCKGDNKTEAIWIAVQDPVW